MGARTRTLFALFLRGCLKSNDSSVFFPLFSFSSFFSAGRLCHDHGLSALFLPGVILLGPHRGLAVLHGSDGEGSHSADPKALSVPGLG